ncbi:DUF5719 family protein [Streptomyces calidiresistens]|uniref:Secreted protein n=1 Tax=Streptomyces calidiresistens TaxID=1485586 RepID=A0A7W3T3M2_9ACTN|nr:DUF5719 family protein [Streptomyces calidiresistens]MBB0230188.1 hypothetical protein [Streptomyces calidiresistens]
MRSTPALSLLAVGVALAAVTGLAGLGDDPAAPRPAGETARVPVERTTLICPQPTRGEGATTWYTAFTPVAEGPADGPLGGAELTPALEHRTGGDPTDDAEDSEDSEDTDDSEDGDDGEDSEDTDAEEDADADAADAADAGDDARAPAAEGVLALEEPGTPVADSTKDADAPALSGTASGRLAPGWTVQQTTRVPSGPGRGLLGTACQTPDTGFWFAGASTVDTRTDYVHLINPDDSATVVDIELYGAEGRLENLFDEGVTLPPNRSVPVRLSTLTESAETNLVVHVTARTGRIGAQIEAIDEQLGTDWLPATTAPAAGPAPIVLPGIPEDAETVRLVALNPGDTDTTFGIRFVGPSATITPAGNESVHLRSNLLESVDLGDVTRGEAGALLLLPPEGVEGVSVIAGLRITRGEGDEQEMAFVSGTAPLERRASSAGNTDKGTELFLTAPGEDVEVTVTLSPGTDGGAAGTETHTVPAGTTLAVAPAVADDLEGRYALTVERTGGGPLYAARSLTMTTRDIPMFTIQSIPDDRSTVQVPETGRDLGVLTR